MSRSVSVLIPVYNAGDLLIEAVDSALAQTAVSYTHLTLPTIYSV